MNETTEVDVKESFLAKVRSVKWKQVAAGFASGVVATVAFAAVLGRDSDETDTHVDNASSDE